MEKFGETIKIKTNTLQDHSYVQDNDVPATRGEKQWHHWMRNEHPYPDHLNWSTETNPSAIRTPYRSAAIQMEEEGPVRGEKEHQAWAQAHVDFLNTATNKANARIPYFSTLAQTEEQDVRGEKEHQAWAQANVDFLNGATNKANARIPYFSTLSQTGEQDVRGEKEHQASAQANVDYLNGATNTANARIPYKSTML